MERSSLPLTEFSGVFRSYFDDKIKSGIVENLREISPLDPDIADLIQTYNHPKGNVIKTLDLSNVYNQSYLLCWRTFLFPATTEAWGEVCLQRVDCTVRKDEVTALAWSSHTGDAATMKMLLRRGAYVDRQLLNGNTVLMETIFAPTPDRIECVKALLSAGARVDLQNQTGHTAMTAAASVGDLKIIKILLSKRHSLDLEHRTKKGHTALTMAATGGHIDAVRYLVEECDANIIVEDNRCYTTLCWAHVWSLPVAAYLSVMLTIQDRVDSFLKRRMELITQQPEDLDLFASFYSICLVFLQIRSVRDLLVRNGSLSVLLNDQKWACVNFESEDCEEDEGDLDNLTKDFLPIVPWIIALTCAMTYNDTYFIEKFLQTDYEKVLKYVNQLAQTSDIDKTARFLTQSVLLPLFSCEKARMRLLEISDVEYESLIKHITDKDDLLSEEMFQIIEFFIDSLNDLYGDMNLKALKRSLDEATRTRIFPTPVNTLRQRLIDVIACFEDFKRMIHQRNAPKLCVSDSEEVPKETYWRLKEPDEKKKETRTRSRAISETKSEPNDKVQRKQECPGSGEPKSSVSERSRTNENRQKRGNVSKVKEKKEPLSAMDEFNKLWVEDLTDKKPEQVRASETSRIRALSELDAYKVKDLCIEPSSPSSCSGMITVPVVTTVCSKKSLENASDVIVLSHRQDRVHPQFPASAFLPVKSQSSKGRGHVSTREINQLQRQKQKERQQVRNMDRCINAKFFNDAGDPNSAKDQPVVCGDAKDVIQSFSVPDSLTTPMDTAKDKLKPNKKLTMKNEKMEQLVFTVPGEQRSSGSVDDSSSSASPSSEESMSGKSSPAVSLSPREPRLRRWSTGSDISSDDELYVGENLSETGDQNIAKDIVMRSSKENVHQISEKLKENTIVDSFFMPSIHDFQIHFAPLNTHEHPPNALQVSQLEEMLFEGGDLSAANQAKSKDASQETKKNSASEVGEWELANPICHTLQKLHQAVNVEGTKQKTPTREKEEVSTFKQLEKLQEGSVRLDATSLISEKSCSAIIGTLTEFVSSSSKTDKSGRFFQTASEVLPPAGSGVTGTQTEYVSPSFKTEQSGSSFFQTASEFVPRQTTPPAACDVIGTQTELVFPSFTTEQTCRDLLQAAREFEPKPPAGSGVIGTQTELVFPSFTTEQSCRGLLQAASEFVPKSPEGNGVIGTQTELVFPSFTTEQSCRSLFQAASEFVPGQIKPPPGFIRQMVPLKEILEWTPQSSRWRHLYQNMTNLPISDFSINGPLYFAPKQVHCLSDCSIDKAVYFGLNKDGGEIVVKCLSKKRGKAIMKAIKQLRQGDLVSANILKYKGFSENDSHIHLETGLCEYNLDEYVNHLTETDKLESAAPNLCRQLLNGLAALHAVDILHMNLKPANVLIDSTGHLRLADFGIPLHMQFCQDGTLCWKPLELISITSIQPYGTKSDIQVAGMLLHYIMTGKHPYGGNYWTSMENIKANKPDLSGIQNQVFANLMTWMLHPQSYCRESAKNCLIHPFFWSVEKMYTFLKLVSQEPEWANGNTGKHEVCETLEQSQEWMDIRSNPMNSVVKTILSEKGIKVGTIGLRHILKAMVIAQDNCKSWPNEFCLKNVKNSKAAETSKNPIEFFMTHYSRAFVGVYDVINRSVWSKKAALSLFFDTSHLVNMC